MIRFNNVSKRYPDGFNALKNINFTVDEGEMVLVMGHSGAGKSTLLKLIAAIERPTFGNVVVNGLDTGKLRKNALSFLRRNIGLIFQDHKILFDRNVFENVLLPLQIWGFDFRTAARRVRASLDKVGLLNREKAYPVTLSGGERQRLCIARAVVHRPSILIADEPTGNLDVSYARDIMDLFESFHQVGVTVLIATHDATLLENKERYHLLSLVQGELVTP